MKKLHWTLLAVSIIFSACEKEEDLLNINFSSSGSSSGCQEVCGEWERCTDVSQDWSVFDWQCTPKLNLYTNHGNWNGQLNVVDESGNTHFYALDDLDAHTQGLQHITIAYPLNNLTYYYDNGVFPDADEYSLSFKFIDPQDLVFTVSDLVYDPFVESVVFYSGSGQIKNTNGSASAVLEFNCNYVFEGDNYTVSFSATRYN